MNKRGEFVPIDEIDFSCMEDEPLPSFSPRPPIDADPEAIKDLSGESGTDRLCMSFTLLSFSPFLIDNLTPCQIKGS